jgi:tetratricopeptide (TPR) repeat protein
MEPHVRANAQPEDSSGDFLLSHAAAGRTEEPPAAVTEDARRALEASFPGMPWGERLRQESMQRLAGLERFAAIVIRPDEARPAEHSPTEQPAGGLLQAIAACLDEMCRLSDAFWGIDSCGLPAAFLPNRSAEDALAMAGEFQERLRGRNGFTATIGVASFPTEDYGAGEVIDNARKAVYHAAFFGPGSRIAFDSVSLNISADAYFDMGENPAAMEEYRRALALDPRNVTARNSLGVCYAVSGDYDRALVEFHAALEQEGLEYMAVYNIGLVHWLRGQKEEALECLLNAEALRGDVFEILFQAGRLHLELGKPEVASGYFERAARQGQPPSSLYRLLGDCHAALARPEKAIAAYRNALRANPADSNALSALGAMYHERGENLDIALMFCRESVELEPDNALFRQRLGELYLKQNRLEEALEEFEKAGSLGLDTADTVRDLRLRVEDRKENCSATAPGSGEPS